LLILLEKKIEHQNGEAEHRHKNLGNDRLEIGWKMCAQHYRGAPALPIADCRLQRQEELNTEAQRHKEENDHMKMLFVSRRFPFFLCASVSLCWTLARDYFIASGCAAGFSAGVGGASAALPGGLGIGW